MTNRQSLVEDE